MTQVRDLQSKIELLKEREAREQLELQNAALAVDSFQVMDPADLEGKIKEQEQKLKEISMVKNVQEAFKVLFTRENKLKAHEIVYEKQDQAFKLFQYELPKRLIAKCKLPVEGIEFRDGELFVEGHSIARRSDAEKAVDTAKIAMAIAKSKGHIAVCLDGVENLDEMHRNEFFKAAEASGLCCIYTRLGEAQYPHEKTIQNGNILN